PQNEVIATYTAGIWRLGRREYRSFECIGPVRLRCSGDAGLRTELGPFESLNASGGAIFAQDACLGRHAPLRDLDFRGDAWNEVAFLRGDA
ncbi:MAG: hypothetical protein ACREUG_07430, partial [Steroidobacteraceae bacterium]